MSVTIKQGHVVDVLAGMEAESCHLAVTSPPYWNLRAYNTEPQVWPELDGRAPCRGGIDLRTGEPIDGHEWETVTYQHHQGTQVEQTKYKGAPTGIAETQRAKQSAFCTRCGAWRGELGQEPTVELYIAHLVAVFRAVKRVLRRDGTCWINLSGSYLNNPGGQNGGTGNTLDYGAGRISQKAMTANKAAGRQDRTGALPRGYWLRPLNFVDTPGLLAHALQADGWIWRADICLVKRSPLPESVQGWRWERCRVKMAPSRVVAQYRHDRPEAPSATEQHGIQRAGELNAEWADCPGCPRCDKTEGYVLRRGNGRPTRAWERLMVFAREPGAFWDSEAVREPSQPDSERRYLTGFTRAKVNGAPQGVGHVKADGYPAVYGNPAGRNLRDWQFFPQNQLRDAHYAAFSPDLASLAIRAGTPERGCCSVCGAPYARVVERGALVARREQPGKPSHIEPQSWLRDGKSRAGENEYSATLGWRPTCRCPQTAPPAPAVVLDCFGGSGSTAIAADRLGRDCVLVDLNADYARMAVRRVTRDAPLLAQVTHDAPPQPTVLALPLDLAGAPRAGGAAAGAGDAAAGE